MSSWMQKEDQETLPERRRDARWLFLAFAILVPLLMILFGSMFKAGEKVAQEPTDMLKPTPVPTVAAKAPGQP